MSRRPITLATITLLAVMTLSLPVSVPNGEASPGNAALQAFESLHKAEASGADIRNLIDQYDLLLQQQTPDASYQAISDLAAQAQQSAGATKNTYTTITIVLIPTIALALSLVTITIVSILKRLDEEKVLDMRIGKRKDV